MRKIIIALTIILGMVFVGILIYFALNPHPNVNKIVKVRNGYELSDTTQYCNSKCDQYFCTYKEEPAEFINDKDTCLKCSKEFSQHHSNSVWGWYESDDISNGL